MTKAAPFKNTPRTVFDKPDTEPRKGLTMPVLLSWALRYMHCGICGCGLSAGFDDDHIKPLWEGGDNSPDNRQPLCKPCHKIKTKGEAVRRAEADRKAGRKGQYARRLKNGSRMQSRGFRKDGPKQKIQSRGFPKKGEREDNTKYLEAGE